MVTGYTIADDVRKIKLREHLNSRETNDLTSKEHCEILSLLQNYHGMFSSLTESEQGETDLLEIQVMPYLRSRLPGRIRLQYDRRWHSI